VQLLDVYTGSEGVLTGTARLAQEAKERAATLTRQQEIERKQHELARKRAAIEREIEMLRAQVAVEEEEVARLVAQTQQAEATRRDQRELLAQERGRDALHGRPADHAS
jgi:circadian clock protein KaiC